LRTARLVGYPRLVELAQALRPGWWCYEAGWSHSSSPARMTGRAGAVSFQTRAAAERDVSPSPAPGHRYDERPV